jgi:hypothetical protein
MTEETLFAEALQHDPADRAGFLEAACGADSVLRRAVEGLLVEHARTGALDAAPPAPAPSVGE